MFFFYNENAMKDAQTVILVSECTWYIMQKLCEFSDA